MKRIGIFIFYDRDGKVDTYERYFLAALNKHLEKFVIVCNGKLSSQGMEQLKKYTTDIFVRDNTGYDAMAFKLAMTTYVGWSVLDEYDELLLINDTFYGPLYPLEEVFTEMEKRDCDFWGLTGHKEYIDYYFGDSQKLPAHIQSYFMAFRKLVFQSHVFQDYWNRFDSVSWVFSDVVNKHERFFTHMLEQAGFSWDTYVHATEYDEKKPEHNFVQYYHAAYQLIKDYRCPIIKKKIFASKKLINNPGEIGNDAAKALLWIAENTDYDIDMIWENILRLYDMKDLQKSLNLNYVISENKSFAKLNTENAMAVTYINQPLTQQQKEYIYLLKSHMEVWHYEICSFKAENENLANDIAKLFNKNIRCEYILLLIHVDDKQDERTALRTYSAIEEQWGNLSGGSAYTASIIDLFIKNKRLGVLTAPSGIHGSDFGMKMEQKLQGCMALWCRKTLLLKMCEEWTDFLKNPYRISMLDFLDKAVHFAQKMGFYTAVGMKPSYVSMAYTNMDEMLRQVERHAKSKYDFDDFGSYLDGDMFLFCDNYSNIYVYGAGDNGSRAAKQLLSKGYHFSGFLVSDNQPDLTEKHGYPIYRLSEVGESLYHAGIVISVTNRKFQTDILRQLQKRGLKNIYLLDT